MKFQPAMIAICAIALPAAASAEQSSLTSAAARTDGSTAVNRAEYGRVSMAPTSSNTCIEGDSNVRRQVFPIRFRVPFRNSAYAVSLGVSGADVDQGRNFRLGTAIESKTRDGMVIVAHTWCNTVIHSLTIDYIVTGLR